VRSLRPALWRRVAGGVGFAVLLLSSFPPVRLSAQDSVIVIDPSAAPSDTAVIGGLPSDVIAEAMRAFTDSSAIRITGGFTVPAGTRIDGDLAVFRGTVLIEGEVHGSVTVVNGDLALRRGGQIQGAVLVAGGRLLRDGTGSIDGNVRVYWDAAPVLRQPDGTLALRERRRTLGELTTARKSFQTGRIRTTLVLGTNQTYNRVEGLPIVFGPTFGWRASPTVNGSLELRGLLRTAGTASSGSEEFGYWARTDWSFEQAHRIGFGLKAYSLMAGIEEHTLPGDEVGWSSFLMQRDYRDYYGTQGVSGSVFVNPVPWLRVEPSLRYQRESSVRANDPWSLFRNTDRWRPNPIIDDGHYTTAGLGLTVDTRDTRRSTTSGWWIRLNYEHTTSQDVAPVTLPVEVRPDLPARHYQFGRVELDARRYTRISPDMRLNLRLWAGGWAGGDPLPVQRRLSLGGLDLLPGYSFRSFTCAPAGYVDPSQAALCDRAVVTQLEFRHHLNLGLGYHLHDRENRELDRFIGIDEADLVVFSDAGKSWLTGDGPGRVPNGRLPVLREWKADVGFGLDLGGIGAYLVKALTDGQPVRVFLRLSRRF